MAGRKVKKLKPSASSTCRELYLHLLSLLVAADLYPQPDAEDLADIILEKGIAPTGDGGQPLRDGRRSGEAWPLLRMQQLAEPDGD